MAERRRRAVGCLTILLVLAIIVCGVGVFADRALANVVEKRLNTAVADNLRNNGTPAAKTDVQVVGFPFITQLLSGDFDGGDVHLTTVKTPEATIDKVDLKLRDVTIPQDVLRGAQPHDITAKTVTGTGQLSVGEIARRFDLKGLKLQSAGSAVRASLPIEVPVVGTVDVSADVTPKLDGNQLTFDVANVSAAGVDVPNSVVRQLTNQFAKPVELALPFAVKLDRVSASNGTLTVYGSAADVPVVK
ncbi:DUF2993 domain-containing protein [Cryptosporangium phraense]|uniref:DUF2993 domain-containing protein n=1 Tax=Cryptosporangium phraense TaxID=2593070 RepID=A0A545AHD8_9ACTN|nr:DUF2993 domain-containing protein [Cryptosporangium phraense]TQS40733.1 DUF2993 domain-containing protein [Cryptosporangium phraense]